MERRRLNETQAKLLASGSLGFGALEYGLSNGDQFFNNGVSLALVTAAAYAINRGLSPAHENENVIYVPARLRDKVSTAAKVVLPLAAGAAAYRTGMSFEDTRSVAEAGMGIGLTGVIFAAISHVRERRRRRPEQ